MDPIPNAVIGGSGLDRVPGLEVVVVGGRLLDLPRPLVMAHRGDAVHAPENTFAAFGLAVLLQTSAMAFLVVKYVGAVYLIYLGIKALKDNSSIALVEDDKQMDARSIMVQGMLSNVLNPKVALFFLAFLPLHFPS